MKTKYLDIVLAAAFLAMVASAFSYTWAPSNPTWGTISLSADGRIICACPSTGGQIRISTNWGQTWSTATSAPPGGSLNGGVALSADGSIIIACLYSNNHLVYLSTNSGSQWSQMPLPAISGFFNYYRVACSADGSKLVAGAEPGPVYFSTNRGINWATSSVPSTNWVSFAFSGDGSRLVGAAAGGCVYASTNFGADWTTNNLPPQAWTSVCISADGQYIGASGTSTYISKNGGASWATNKLIGQISCSADGSTWMIAGPQVYTSQDSGLTWATNLASGSYNGGISADGCEIIVANGYGGGITAGRVVPRPQLSLQASSGTAIVSWLLPSTNFVIQQTADISTGNWQTLTNNPALNLTNLNEQVAVPVNDSNAFFRLSAQ